MIFPLTNGSLRGARAPNSSAACSDLALRSRVVTRRVWRRHTPDQPQRAAGLDRNRTLIRADERRKAEEALEAKLLEGLRSAEREFSPEDWKAIRKEALSGVEARKTGR